MRDADERVHEFSLRWPTEPLNSLRKRSDTIGEELCSVVLGTNKYDGERLSAAISELGAALGLLYEQSPRLNFNKVEYKNGVFRAPQGEPNLENIAVIQMEGSEHPPRHLRLMPINWREDKPEGIENVEGYRDWAWYSASHTDERRSLITGYSIPFKQGAVFIGLDLNLLPQWKDEVETHHEDPPTWATKPFTRVIPELPSLYSPLSERLLDPARPEREGSAYTRPAHLD